MKRVFIDTGALAAIADTKDRFHRKARTIYQGLEEENTEFVTTDYVLAETYTLIRLRVSHRAAVAFGEALRSKQDITIVRITDSHLDRAWQIFKRYSDKAFSFVDCSSFAVLEEQHIKEVFTFDHHFEQYGFRVLK